MSIFFVQLGTKSSFSKTNQKSVFQIYEGSGEWFDLSKKPIERASFAFGKAMEQHEGYEVTDSCIGCGSCLDVCPQKCIDLSETPAVIKAENCLH